MVATAIITAQSQPGETEALSENAQLVAKQFLTKPQSHIWGFPDVDHEDYIFQEVAEFTPWQSSSGGRLIDQARSDINGYLTLMEQTFGGTTYPDQRIEELCMILEGVSKGFFPEDTIPLLMNIEHLCFFQPIFNDAFKDNYPTVMNAVSRAIMAAVSKYPERRETIAMMNLQAALINSHFTMRNEGVDTSLMSQSVGYLRYVQIFDPSKFDCAVAYFVAITARRYCLKLGDMEGFGELMRLVEKLPFTEKLFVALVMHNYRMLDRDRINESTALKDISKEIEQYLNQYGSVMVTERTLSQVRARSAKYRKQEA